MTSQTTAAPRPQDHGREDARDWAFYLAPGERLLATWRPDDTFRVYGAGKAIMTGSVVFVGLMLVAQILFGDGRGGAGMIVLAAGMLGIAALLGFGPALLDRRNRRARRYAVSNRRALEFQDIRRGRLRSVTFGANTRALKLYNENLASHELSFVNLDEEGRAVRSVLFERLTETQMENILQILRRDGIAPRIIRATHTLTAIGKRKNLLLGQRRQ